MSKLIDITGQRFGRLVAVEEAGRCNFKQVLWRCRCDCGNESIVRSRDLRSGHSKSCGCFAAEGGRNLLRHGLSHTREHNIWRLMQARCTTNPQSPRFRWYGSRGIRVAEVFLGTDGFLRFLAEVGFSPSPKHSIDRIDNDGNYEPGNIRWATAEQQANNQRKRRK